MTRAALAPADRARLTLDAIEAVEAIGAGEWSIEDARQLLGDDLDAGLVEYVGFLEASLTLARGVADPLAIRAAARASAQGLLQAGGL